ncbi:MAG: hypothetical protein R3F43_19215 [bacterium]
MGEDRIDGTRARQLVRGHDVVAFWVSTEMSHADSQPFKDAARQDAGVVIAASPPGGRGVAALARAVVEAVETQAAKGTPPGARPATLHAWVVPARAPCYQGSSPPCGHTMFTQSAFVLTSKPFPLEDIETTLAAFSADACASPRKITGLSAGAHPRRPAAWRKVIVDVIDRDWKDNLDDDDDPIAKSGLEAGGWARCVPRCHRAGGQAGLGVEDRRGRRARPHLPMCASARCGWTRAAAPHGAPADREPLGWPS